MFEGDSADTCTGKFPLMLMLGWAEGPAYADPGVKTPLGVSENSQVFQMWGNAMPVQYGTEARDLCQEGAWQPHVNDPRELGAVPQAGVEL